MRRLGIILIGMGIVVAVSCSKEEVDDTFVIREQESVQDTTIISDLTIPGAIFEGEWRLSEYAMTCEGLIVVNSDSIVFDIPADYLFKRLEIVTETNKYTYPDEPLFTSSYTFFNTKQVMRYSTQGFSTNATYVQNIGVDNVTAPHGYNAVVFYAQTNNADYEITLYSIKEQPSAVFDNNTGLWTMAIPIDKVNIYNSMKYTNMNFEYLHKEAPDKSAWLLVFRATKRIK